MFELYAPSIFWHCVDYWKTHPDVAEILRIQSKSESGDATRHEAFNISSDDESENVHERAEADEDSDSADDSDDESEEEESEEEIPASNKFAALADDD